MNKKRSRSLNTPTRPLKRMLDLRKRKTVNKLRMFTNQKRFSENVRNLIAGRRELQIDDSVFELLAYVMVTDFNMFRARVKLRIMGESNG
jgi:hypothetical protein